MDEDAGEHEEQESPEPAEADRSWGDRMEDLEPDCKQLLCVSLL